MSFDDMMFIDPHVHMISRTTDDYEAMRRGGVVAVIEPAFWIGQPRTNAGSMLDYFSMIVGWERFRAKQFGIQHYCTIGLNAKEANNEELAEEDERSLFGDKAYSRTPSNRPPARTAGITGFWTRPNGSIPLIPSQKRRNKRHQRVRSKVEHPFAAIKDRYGMRLTKAKTKLRKQARFLMATICWNIERSITWPKKRPGITAATTP